jgi:phosphoribosylglycinamide formyltransferase-1
MKKIVLFASGSGTNAENIILYFRKSNFAKVEAIFTNNPNAQVIDRAKKLQVPTIVFSKVELESDVVLKKIEELKPDLIVLAGFLWQFPTKLIHHYPNAIINIHPALLPKYGGKGMYGMKVHQAILDNKEKETGISIHYVNEQYDEGEIIFQKSIATENCSSPEAIAEKIHELEFQYFPQVIEKLLKDQS